MNNGEAADSAATRLQQLHEYFREHPVTGAPTGRIATSRNASAPLSLDTLDYISASVAEVVDQTRALNPKAGQPPARVEAVYDWCREHTAHADETEALRRETVIYRQQIEHALRLGEVKVIRPHRCPKCRTFGLMWEPTRQRALCTNTECTDKDGFSSTFSVARLAYEHVAARKNLRHVSTT